MTTTTATSGDATTGLVPVPARPALRVTWPRVLRAEWTKFRSLRSSWVTLVTAAMLTIGLGAAFAAGEVARWDRLDPTQRLRFNATDFSLGGVTLAQLAIGVLGVLIITGEYGTGTIRSTLMAVPRRQPVLWAKSAIIAVTTFVVMLPTAVLAFLAGQSVLSGKGLDVPISGPGTPRALVGAALYVTLIALLGIGLGAMLRNTAAAISTLTGVLLVLPLLTKFLPGSWSQDVGEYLPSNAGQAVMSVRIPAGSLAPWTGFALLCGYTLVVLIAGAITLARRDA